MGYVHVDRSHLTQGCELVTDRVTIGLGRALFLVAIAALGAQCLVRGNVVPALEPVTLSASTHPLVGWITGIALIAAAIASIPRASARYGALAIAGILILWVALLHVPALIASPGSGGEWTGAFETFALAGAALSLAGLAPGTLAKQITTVGRIFYAVSLPVFGVLHFLYIGYVASVIPAWIPAHVAFGYATGTAHIAAGVGLTTGVLGRIAALCAAAMFGSWVLILHAPRVLAHIRDANEWTSLLIALAMCGGALAIAGTMARAPAQRPATEDLLLAH